MSFRAELAGTHTVIFVDNQSALGMLTKAAGKAADLAAIAVHAAHALLRSATCLTWVWVPSRLNIADAPSRGKIPIVGTRTPLRVQWRELELTLQSLSD
jgi:hypothetical protein